MAADFGTEFDDLAELFNFSGSDEEEKKKKEEEKKKLEESQALTQQTLSPKITPWDPLPTSTSKKVKTEKPTEYWKPIAELKAPAPVMVRRPVSSTASTVKLSPDKFTDKVNEYVDKEMQNYQASPYDSGWKPGTRRGGRPEGAEALARKLRRQGFYGVSAEDVLNGLGGLLQPLQDIQLGAFGTGDASAATLSRNSVKKILQARTRREFQLQAPKVYEPTPVQRAGDQFRRASGLGFEPGENPLGLGNYAVDRAAQAGLVTEDRFLSERQRQVQADLARTDLRNKQQAEFTTMMKAEDDRQKQLFAKTPMGQLPSDPMDFLRLAFLSNKYKEDSFGRLPLNNLDEINAFLDSDEEIDIDKLAITMHKQAAPDTSVKAAAEKSWYNPYGTFVNYIWGKLKAAPADTPDSNGVILKQLAQALKLQNKRVTPKNIAEQYKIMVAAMPGIDPWKQKRTMAESERIKLDQDYTEFYGKDKAETTWLTDYVIYPFLSAWDRKTADDNKERIGSFLVGLPFGRFLFGNDELKNKFAIQMGLLDPQSEVVQRAEGMVKAQEDLPWWAKAVENPYGDPNLTRISSKAGAQIGIAQTNDPEKQAVVDKLWAEMEGVVRNNYQAVRMQVFSDPKLASADSTGILNNPIHTAVFQLDRAANTYDLANNVRKFIVGDKKSYLESYRKDEFLWGTSKDFTVAFAADMGTRLGSSLYLGVPFAMMQADSQLSDLPDEHYKGNMAIMVAGMMLGRGLHSQTATNILNKTETMAALRASMAETNIARYGYLALNKASRYAPTVGVFTPSVANTIYNWDSFFDETGNFKGGQALANFAMDAMQYRGLKQAQRLMEQRNGIHSNYFIKIGDTDEYITFMQGGPDDVTGISSAKVGKDFIDAFDKRATEWNAKNPDNPIPTSKIELMAAEDAETMAMFDNSFRANMKTALYGMLGRDYKGKLAAGRIFATADPSIIRFNGENTRIMTLSEMLQLRKNKPKVDMSNEERAVREIAMLKAVESGEVNILRLAGDAKFFDVFAGLRESAQLVLNKKEGGRLRLGEEGYRRLADHNELVQKTKAELPGLVKKAQGQVADLSLSEIADDILSKTSAKKADKRVQQLLKYFSSDLENLYSNNKCS